MGKKLSVLVIAIFVIGLLAGPALAAGKTGQAGNSNIGHLYLYEKDPTTWEIVPGGAWGKMKYNLSGSQFEFVFNGHGLPVGQAFTMIYYPDPWPGNGVICLGDGVVDEYGDVHIMGAVDTGSLPAAGDTNEGAKVWLVLSSHVSCGAQMTGWDPTAYLFENDLITFDDTDDVLLP